MLTSLTSNDRLLKRFATLLGAWLIVIFLNKLWVELDHSLRDDPFALWRIWHPTWSAPINSSITFVVLALFAPVIARRWGGWKTSVGRVAWMLALAPASFAIGNLVWFWYNTCTAWGALGCETTTDIPYPAWSDPFFIGLVIFVGGALISLGRVLNVTRRDLWKVVAIAAVMFPPVAYFTWTFDIGGETYGQGWVHDPSGTSVLEGLGQLLTLSASRDDLANLTSAGYVAMDVVLVAGAVMLLSFARRVAGGMFLAPVVAIALGLLVQFAADMVFLRSIANETFEPGGLADVLYSFSIWGFAVMLFMLGRVTARIQHAAATAPQE
jgi:hypothetical protein